MPRLTVATFNIRYGSAADGPNHWENRWPLVADVIRKAAADVLCVQECEPFQADHVVYSEPRYQCVGVSRHDGKKSGGEMVPIFWRADRLNRIDAGHFWLSPDPHLPGVAAWGATYPRVVTWATLRLPGGPAFTVFNAHFDYASSRAREESANLLHRRATAVGSGMPVIVAGDFNGTDADPAYQTLTTDRLSPGDALVDVYRATHPTPGPDDGTLHDFTGTATRRIDWLLASPHWTVNDCRIDRTSRDGMYPSDHFPVVAELLLRAG